MVWLLCGQEHWRKSWATGSLSEKLQKILVRIVDIEKIKLNTTIKITLLVSLSSSWGRSESRHQGWWRFVGEIWPGASGRPRRPGFVDRPVPALWSTWEGGGETVKLMVAVAMDVVL